ncbi:hypothetical protein JCM10449v2_007967 [Rhodotorula kratochvilovae]
MPAALSSPVSSPTTARTRTSSRTDKRALLDALAAQLKHEKARAEDWAAKMVAVEDQVEAKHREFLDEEARLSALRDANAALIASLRRDLARARHTLEEALHVEAHEAEAYLALLSGERQAAREEAAAARAASEGGATSESADGHESAYGYPHSASPPPMDARDFPPSTAPSSIVIRPPRPERPTSLIVGHPFQRRDPPYTLPAGMRSPGAAPTSAELALDRSVWRDSLDEQRDGAVHPELQRNGGRWSRVFPGLIRRRSSSQAVA